MQLAIELIKSIKSMTYCASQQAYKKYKGYLLLAGTLTKDILVTPLA